MSYDQRSGFRESRAQGVQVYDSKIASASAASSLCKILFLSLFPNFVRLKGIPWEMYDHCSEILLRLEWKFGTVRSGQNDQKCSQKLREKKPRTIWKIGLLYVIHNYRSSTMHGASILTLGFCLRLIAINRGLSVCARYHA